MPIKNSSRKHGDAQRWPAVEEQLAAAKAIPGSALERLIRDNQQFDMLDPAEVNDVWRLPPWFRVYWRRKHPEIKYKGPQVAYPLILKRLLEWMLHNQDLNADLIAMKA